MIKRDDLNTAQRDDEKRRIRSLRAWLEVESRVMVSWDAVEFDHVQAREGEILFDRIFHKLYGEFVAELEEMKRWILVRAQKPLEAYEMVELMAKFDEMTDAMRGGKPIPVPPVEEAPVTP